MSLYKASTRIGLFAILLGVIVLSLFGSLAAADRALATADRRAARMDARAEALTAERELRSYGDLLEELFAPLLPSGAVDTQSLALAIPEGTFDGVWIMDLRGQVVWRLASDAASIVDAATLARAATDAVPGTGLSVRGLATDSTRGMLITVPLGHRGAALGAASGFVTGARFLEQLDHPASRPRLSIQFAGQSLGTVGDNVPRYALITADAPLNVRGDPLVLSVAHAQSGRAVRTVLWMLGVVGLAALLVGLARERRQAMHLAGRTAELERLYQEVARSNRMKSEFLANVSHELRTPLNAIVGFVEMLREGVYGDLTPRQALPVDRIAASATHLRQLVDRLLDIAKIAAGRLEIHIEPLVLRPFVLNVASEMESLISERGLALSVDVSPSLSRIRTDQNHLRQILINLIGNAVKYTPTGGIQVRARIVGDGVESDPPGEQERHAGSPPDPHRKWIALQVSDTGVGIVDGDLERIFDEFEQVNAGARTDSAQRGTGLGLAISRRLARLLGGDLTVVSEAGRGSTFTLWLPLEFSQAES